MSNVSLLGAVALAASLAAVPAFAQNGGANNGNGTATRGAGNYLYTTNGPQNVGTMERGANVRSVVNPRAYANVGYGSYTARQAFIRNGNNGNNNGNNGNANNNDWRPSQRNSDLADNGDARASKVIGTGVFNTRNQQLGSVNDILIGSNGVYAVISTNNKKVAVPFQELRFGNTVNNGNNQIVIPNATQAQLNTEPAFHYNVTNYQAYQNAGNGNGWFGNNGNGGHGVAYNNNPNNGWLGGGAFGNGNGNGGHNGNNGGNGGNNGGNG